MVLHNQKFESLQDERWVGICSSGIYLSDEYFVSQLGRIAKNNHYRGKHPQECELVCPTENHSGDLIFSLRKSGGVVTTTVKKAVFEMFSDGSQGLGRNISHNNRNQLDNRIGNLFAYCPKRSADQKRRITAYIKTLNAYDLNAFFNEVEAKRASK